MATEYHLVHLIRRRVAKVYCKLTLQHLCLMVDATGAAVAAALAKMPTRARLDESNVVHFNDVDGWPGRTTSQSELSSSAAASPGEVTLDELLQLRDATDSLNVEELTSERYWKLVYGQGGGGGGRSHRQQQQRQARQ